VGPVDRERPVLVLVLLAILGAFALSHTRSPSGISSPADQQAALAWANQNPQMWSWMQSHWSEMALMHQHWGDTAWMRTHLPDWTWMQARWNSMTWMHEHWPGMDRMHEGMMGGTVPGMMGSP
jgi:hypothetical protein